jgi:lipopolysaccharide export system protein LptA
MEFTMLFKRLCAALLFAHCCVSLAISSDHNESIEIDADSAEFIETSGLTKYRGNVIIKQGSIIIVADEVTIYYQNNKVSRIFCTGLPASYTQESATDQTNIFARAETIEYQLAEDIIHLKTNASLSRNGTFIKGDSINYDLTDGTWKAKGDDLGGQKRIQLVIPPFTQSTPPAFEPEGKIEQQLEEVK